MVDVVIVEIIADDLAVEVVDIHVVLTNVVEVIHALASQFVIGDVELTNNRTLILIDRGSPAGMKALVPTNVFAVTVVEIFIIVVLVDDVLEFFPPDMFVLVLINAPRQAVCRRSVVPETEVDLAVRHLRSGGIFDRVQV